MIGELTGSRRLEVRCYKCKTVLGVKFREVHTPDTPKAPTYTVAVEVLPCWECVNEVCDIIMGKTKRTEDLL